eukprot:14823934-Ditylum_brightwellii.AAC.1
MAARRAASMMVSCEALGLVVNMSLTTLSAFSYWRCFIPLPRRVLLGMDIGAVGQGLPEWFRRHVGHSHLEPPVGSAA